MAVVKDGVHAQRIRKNFDFEYDKGDKVEVNYPVNSDSFLTSNGGIVGRDQNGDGSIGVGETITYNTRSPGIITQGKFANATVKGVGEMGGFITGIAVRYPVILVEYKVREGFPPKTVTKQALIYPEGRPDLITTTAGVINTKLTFYKKGRYEPDVGVVPCFVRGTFIATPDGQVLVEDIKAGDLVLTKDHGPQTVRWVGRRAFSADQLSMKENLRPIRIKAGAFAEELPLHDLVISPQHRVVMKSEIVKEMTGEKEVLVAAKQLLSCDDINIDDKIETVEYFHIMFERHEIVYANGMQVESLYAGPQALKSLPPSSLDELLEIFPELEKKDAAPVPARSFVTGKDARQIADLHIDGQQPLYHG